MNKLIDSFSILFHRELIVSITMLLSLFSAAAWPASQNKHNMIVVLVDNMRCAVMR